MIAVSLGATELSDQYVASFGKDAALGCFTAAEPASLSRRDRVLLRTSRGLEVGEILTPATIRQARLLGAHVRGDLLRSLTAEDRPTVERMASLARRVLDEAERLAPSLDAPPAIIDAEVFFDLRHALLHVLHPRPDDLADFVDDLARRTGLVVRLADLAVPAEKPLGCGEPNCGGGECSSCSTGGCSTGCGSTKSSPPDLTPYFAHLRDRMSARRVPLV